MADLTSWLRRLAAPLVTSPHRRLVIGVTFRLTVLFIAIALYALVARETYNRGELLVSSVLALTGFVAFTSAVDRLMRLAGGRDSAANRSVPDALGAAASPHDPDVLASLLLAHARPHDGVMTLAGATACLVREVGPVALPLVMRALDTLVRHQAIVPDFDEATDQRCWRFPATPRATRLVEASTREAPRAR
jgi:hypothetical protein